MATSPLPVLRCESRRQPPYQRHLFLWGLAVFVISATTLDAFWSASRRVTRGGAHHEIGAVPRADAPRPTRELRVNDVELVRAPATIAEPAPRQRRRCTLH